jgi:serine phosphatase RsbU (regulator of sigma subunit)/anti-sigma regulatory factor (Ser/Thr protein kinase)
VVDRQRCVPEDRAAGGDDTVDCHQLGEGLEAVRAGRHFVHRRALTLGANDVADDAALVAAELLANAVQHGDPPVVVCARAVGDAFLVEVTDGSPRSPVRPAPSTSNMTGRGLALVEALSASWGVRRDGAGGKTVWSELRSAPRGSRAGAADELSNLLAQWEDDPGTPADRHTVVLGDVPTALLLEAKAHIDNLVREFTLAAAAGESGDAVVPPHLARLIDTVVHGFSAARAAIKRQALAAAARGAVRTSLTLHLPLTAAAAGEAYLQALDEADAYARAARLLTLETPSEHRLFRRWYVGAVIEQLQAIAIGEPPPPIRSFEEELVAEVRRLSEAQQVSDRAARLQRVTAALARARTPEDVAAAVVSEGVGALGASGGGLLVPAADNEHITVPGVVGYGEELVGQLRAERIDAQLPAATALRTGESVWVESREARDQRFPELRGMEAGTLSMCAVPLWVGDRVIGALRFSFAARKLFDDDERRFVEALAAQTAATLQRTELYAAERQASLELQRALLPGALVSVAGWDIAAHYSPAGEQEAGGDFYDVIPLADGRLAAVVGDVMGRGVEAAASMAQIRSTIRAYALDDPEPAAVFRRVDAFFESLSGSQLVTVLYALVDPRQGSIRLINAGHLQPLLVDPGGASLAAHEGGLPFGVQPEDRDVVELQLSPGASLVIVTDGLVERRGEDIDEGVARILDVAGSAHAESARALLSRIITASSSERIHDDDVTVLVLRRT